MNGFYLIFVYVFVYLLHYYCGWWTELCCTHLSRARTHYHYYYSLFVYLYIWNWVIELKWMTIDTCVMTHECRQIEITSTTAATFESTFGSIISIIIMNFIDDDLLFNWFHIYNIRVRFVVKIDKLDLDDGVHTDLKKIIQQTVIIAMARAEGVTCTGKVVSTSACAYLLILI